MYPSTLKRRNGLNLVCFYPDYFEFVMYSDRIYKGVPDESGNIIPLSQIDEFKRYPEYRKEMYSFGDTPEKEEAFEYIEDKICFEDEQQLSFMQAIDLIKAEPDDEKVSVSSRFYEQFDSNSDAFDQMLVAEEEVSMEKVMVAGNDAKIIRLLKAMKTEPRLTDDQEQIIDKLIMLWENGEIPAKVSKDVMKKSKVVGDVLGLYYEILKLVPPTYFEERKNQKAQVDGKKQIVLSCYLKTGGTR